jgi:hypothetical protein
VKLSQVEYDITWGGEVEDMSLRTAGQASLQGLRTYLQEGLSDSRWQPGMRVLVDHRELDWSTTTNDDLRARVASMVKERERFGRAHVAVVLARPVDYGLHRVMQALSDDWADVIDLELFYTVEEARAWLSQFPPPGRT